MKGDKKMDIVLDEKFSFDNKYVENVIAELAIDNCICGRYTGIQCEKEGENTNILAWQCNIADIQNYDIKLPLIMNISVDQNNIVCDVDIYENFKGSQGIPCSLKYLNRQVKEILVNEVFSINNQLFNNQNVFSCRHVFELVYGACALLNSYAENKNHILVSELSGIELKNQTLYCYDKIKVNEEIVESRLEISNFINNIKYDASGKVVKVNNMEICQYEYQNKTWISDGKIEILSAKDNREYVMKMMRILSKPWMRMSNKLLVKKKVYYSTLWPPTFFGILSQAFGIAIFNKNLTYFQHSIYGLQRDDNGHPLCIGVIDNIDEGTKYFKGFSFNDL